MSPRKKIAFYILFPIISILVSLILIFYIDLANGPLIIFILELIFLLAAITMRFILRNKKFVIRMIPVLALVAANAIMLPLDKPSVERKSAAYYANPVKTEVLSLANGDIQGVLNYEKDVRIYAGVPYAKAPIGDLRWKETVPVEDWEGVKDCSYFGPKSMQEFPNSITNTLVELYSEKGWHPNFNMIPEQDISEDSLYLNIWRPNNDETNLPILVFIHGGSLTTGSSAYDNYNGEEMAKTGVIMITITYRLGVFGYFAHPDLIEESPNNTTGNYGLLDQIEALKWINNNAIYFGGDKNNITIAGESAGSSSVSALCTSPLAKNLFKRAIGESSSLVLKVPPHTYRKMEDALKTGEKIMQEFNCTSIEDLRKIPASKLVTTKNKNSSMTLDGYALNKDPYQVYADHENNEVALLNGYNVKEADAFVIPQFLFNPTNKNNIYSRLVSTFGEEIAKKIYDLYKDRINQDAFNAFNEIFSVYWFIYPHHSWSKMALFSGINVYRYQFTKFNGYYETYHSGEMIYAYGNVARSRAIYPYRYDDKDVELSHIMLSYWSNFAKTGNPNGEALSTWDSYVLNGEVQELGANVGPIADKYLALYDILDEFMDLQLS